MKRDVKTYFEGTVIPLISKEYPQVVSEMSIQILGSYGLGIADKFSDLDSVIWLDDPLWKARGGHVQLMLEHCPQKFTPRTDIHCEICVWPLSWLRERREFLESKSDLPWEKVTFGELFELQENLILRDPDGIFRRLREATVPERFPGWLWKKLLILKLREVDDDLYECQQVLKRGRMLEAQIILARVLEGLLHLGFLINRRYYPWRTHLRWAFERLPALASRVSPDINMIMCSSNWGRKIASIEAIRDTYTKYIREKNILSQEILQDLLWAERCEAWSDPNWRDWVTRCKRNAKEAGHDESDFWIWSLWGWV